MGIKKDQYRDFIQIEADEKVLKEFNKTKIGALMARGLFNTGKFKYEVGDTYQLADLNGVSIKFLGLFDSDDSTYNRVILVGGQYAEEVDDELGVSSQIYVKIDDIDNAQKVCKAIDEYALGIQTETQPQKAFLEQAKRELEDVINFQRIVMLVAIIVILVGVANTISMATRDRVREIGVLRSVGFERSKILGIVLLEAMFVALIGGIVGTVAATGYMAVMNTEDAYMSVSVPLKVGPMVFISAMILPFALGLVGGLPSAYAASRMPIVDSLRNAD